MKTQFMIRTAFLLVWSVFLSNIPVSGQMTLPYPDLSTARGSGSKGQAIVAKLSADLRILADQFSGGSKGVGADAPFSFRADDLKHMYGIDAGSADPWVSIAVTIRKNADVELLNRKGMTVYMTRGNIVYGRLPVRSLTDLATDVSVITIASTKSARAPELPIVSAPPELIAQLSASTPKGAKANPLANEFNKSSLSGKGVIVGVIDSGIDWKHPDFIKPDGTSRILAIWDMYDDSYKSSGGTIGTSGPKIDPTGKTLPGTIYTSAQINAALKGTGTVNTVDNQGHGTAVAGTAAGNGRASAGKNSGVAPDADLIIVKASDCAGFTQDWIYGAAWISQLAASLKKPLVVNGSFGGHFSAHDGNESEEIFVNALTGPGKPGVIFTIAAGNEGRSSMHATGRFGPKRPNQADITSSPISVTISQERTAESSGQSYLLGVFDSRDDWAVAIVPSANASLKDKSGKPMTFFLTKTGAQIKYTTPAGLVPPDVFAGLMNAVMKYSQLGPSVDMLTLPLPFGTYDIWGFSTSDLVANGSFDFYALSDDEVDFGRGTTKTGMVGSPGNAANVITVAAYNFRPSWINVGNAQTVFNLPIGQISDYSSPGGKRKDGVVKPDIAAPATFTVSPLSAAAALGSTTCRGRNMGAGSGEKFVLPGGKYVAWQGTSASSPFTAGVIALMLQKNPTLDAEQARQILIKSARKGGSVGAVPNPEWGYGMLDPAAAIAATPARPPAK